MSEDSLLKRWQKTIFPIQPTDTARTRMFKHSAFYLFAVMVILISAVIAIAIVFVL